MGWKLIIEDKDCPFFSMGRCQKDDGKSVTEQLPVCIKDNCKTALRSIKDGVKK